MPDKPAPSHSVGKHSESEGGHPAKARAGKTKKPAARKNRRRPIQTKLWATDDEAQALKDLAYAEGMSVQGYLLASTVYAKEIEGIPSRSELASILTELKRQGNNLNRIARALNMTGGLTGGDQAREILEGLENERKVLRKLEEILPD